MKCNDASNAMKKKILLHAYRRWFDFLWRNEWFIGRKRGYDTIHTKLTSIKIIFKSENQKYQIGHYKNIIKLNYFICTFVSLSYYNSKTSI